MNKLAYLAHPIDLATPQEGLLKLVTADLVGMGFIVYNPESAFRIPGGIIPSPQIGKINQAALEQSDVFVIVSPEAPTIGTVLELAYAAQSGKPTVVISQEIDRSWSLAALADSGHIYLTPLWTLESARWIQDAFNTLPARPDSGKTHLKYMFNESAGPFETAYLCNYGPERNYDGDAGFDLYVTEDTEIPVGKFADIPCGINIELPEGTWGLIIGRSSTLRKHNLMVMPGVIDNGYRGPLYTGVYNMNGEQFSAKRGMRLAQFIPFPLTAQNMVPRLVPMLSASDRGERGFGSTGE